MIRKFSTLNTTSLNNTESHELLTDKASSDRTDTSGHGQSIPDSKESSKQIGVESPDNLVITETAEVRTAYWLMSSDDESVDEGLSMSEEEDHLPPDPGELTKMLSDLDIDHKLLSAAQRGQSDLVKDLLNSGARLITDETGTTAMHVAAQNGFADVVRLLLESSTDMDIPDSGGYTALHKSAAHGHLDVSELLINEGCDIDTQDDTYGNTPLHEAAWHGFSKSVDLLLKNKSNAFITNMAGCTPLHLAAQNGHNQSGRTLLYAGCSPDVKNNYGDTPLHTAARYGHAGLARILISAKCSISEQNKNGDTALHIAAAFKRRKIAKLLIEGGMNTMLRNKQDEKAVDIARRKDHPQIIDIIHECQQQHKSSAARLTYGDSPRLVPTNEIEREAQETPDSNKENKKKSSFVSWIKKKFGKEKTSAVLNNQESWKDPKNRLQRQKVFDKNGEEAGLFSQYVKKPGFAYYRDLAGNIRQGPMGFVPACQCEARVQQVETTVGKTKQGVYNHLNETHHLLNERMANLEHHTNRQVQNVDKKSQEKIAQEKVECIDRLNRYSAQESSAMRRQLAQVESHLRDNLQSWLETQISEGRDIENPFAYAVGAKQTRFGDDFDQQRQIRYEATEQFPPPPRLFRSRSDETLSHSEYSYHGRAFKSREAAMEELKTLKQHEEIREKRKRIRAGIQIDGPIQDDCEYEDLPSRRHRGRFNQHRANLWMSRDNLGLDDEEEESLTPTRHQSTLFKRHSYVEMRRESDKDRLVSQLPFESNVDNGDTIPPTQNSSAEQFIQTTEKSKENEAKVFPLKSAMRKGSESSQHDHSNHTTTNRISHVRSSSLPAGDTKLYTGEATPDSVKKTKTVHYDETILSAEPERKVKDDLDVPTVRETPIGASHDLPNKYSDNPVAGTPSTQTVYKQITSVHPQKNNQSFIAQSNPQSPSAESGRNIRDHIVSTRNELLARSNNRLTSDMKHLGLYGEVSQAPQTYNGQQQSYTPRSSNEQRRYPVNVTPQQSMIQVNHTINNQQSMPGTATPRNGYTPKNYMQQNRQPTSNEVPFSHYKSAQQPAYPRLVTNSNQTVVGKDAVNSQVQRANSIAHTQRPQQAIYGSIMSLGRQAKSADSLQRRVYPQQPSQRNGIQISQHQQYSFSSSQNNQIQKRPVPDYAEIRNLRTQPSSQQLNTGYNQGSAPVRKQLPSYEEIQNQRQGIYSEVRLPSNTDSYSQTNHNSAYTQHRYPPTQQVTNPPYQPSHIAQQPKQPIHRLNASNSLTSKPSAVNTQCQNTPAEELGSPQPANTGSCSSSNPDSGYGGRIYDGYQQSGPMKAKLQSQINGDYESWYGQRLQAAAARQMHPSFAKRYNMTSDV